MSSNNVNGRNGPLTVTMSRKSYDVIMETLAMDLDSSYIDKEIKEDIEKAVNDTKIISSNKSVNPYVKNGSILLSECCKAEALYRVSDLYGFDLFHFCPSCMENCEWDEVKEEVVISDLENKDMGLNKDNQEFFKEIVRNPAPTFEDLNKDPFQKDNDLSTINPEQCPTCHGCGGQKEHPTKEFSYPPENGLCQNELDECGQIDDYIEGSDCPFCMAEYDDFYIATEGGVNDDYLQHNYQCLECEKEWYNLRETTTWEKR